MCGEIGHFCAFLSFLNFFMKILKKLLQILRICDILFLAVKKTLTALVHKNVLKLTDRVGFLTNYFLKNAEKPGLSVKMRYITLEPKIFRRI